MNWNYITDMNQLDKIVVDSQQIPQLIFKHSTRCFISASVLRRFESEWALSSPHVATHFLDLLQYRNLSNLIADRFQVEHESPQIIIIHKGKTSFHTSHDSISMETILTALPQ